MPAREEAGVATDNGKKKKAKLDINVFEEALHLKSKTKKKTKKRELSKIHVKITEEGD